MPDHVYARARAALTLLPVAWLVIWLCLNIQALGSGFAYLQSDIALDYVMGVLWWVVFAIAILLLGGESRQMLLTAWLGKFFVTLIAMLFYEQHYGLDSYSYLELRQTGNFPISAGVDIRDDLMPTLTDAGGGDRLGARNEIKNTLRLVYMVGLVTGPYFHAMKVGCAFLGFVGTWWFYRAVTVALGRPYPPAFYLLAFFPSLIFWGSILGKDPIQFLFLGLYAYGGTMWFVKGRLSALWLVGAGLLGASLMRPWTAAIGAVSLLLATFLGRCRRWQVIGALLLLPLGVALSGGGELGMWFLGNKDVLEEMRGLAEGAMILELIRMKTEGIVADTRASSGSGVDLSDLTSGEAVMSNMPVAMFSGLFRPLPFDITNPFTALAAIENTVVLLLAFVAIFHLRFGHLRDPLVLWTVLYTLFWTSTHGFIVMANFGSGVRYKLQVWPFLLMAILLLAHREGRALLASRRAAKPAATNPIAPGQG